MGDHPKDKLFEIVQQYKTTELGTALKKLLIERRERFRDDLEGANNDETRGRAKECKELLKYFE